MLARVPLARRYRSLIREPAHGLPSLSARPVARRTTSRMDAASAQRTRLGSALPKLAVYLEVAAKGTPMPTSLLRPTSRALLACALALGAWLASGSALAQQQGLPLQMTTYLGLSAGKARWAMDCTGTTTCSGQPASYRFYGGQINANNFGLEFTLASLGNPSATYPTGNASFSGSSLDLSALYRFGRADSALNFFLKGGLAYTRLSTSSVIAGTPAGDNKTSYAPIVGAGLMYNVNDSLALRAEFSTLNAKAPGGTSGRINSVTFGAQAHY